FTRNMVIIFLYARCEKLSAPCGENLTTKNTTARTEFTRNMKVNISLCSLWTTLVPFVVKKQPPLLYLIPLTNFIQDYHLTTINCKLFLNFAAKSKLLSELLQTQINISYS
ncbi:hypothetical protein EGM88_10405, partial [Aureibaculum marinum]